MSVHLFGAGSFSECANFGLKQIVNDYFHMDDGLKYLLNINYAINLVVVSKELCTIGGQTLHKFASNTMEVLDTVQANDRARRYVDFFQDHFLEERVVGIDWCIESYSLQFRITTKVRPLTRRENLATVSSVYDPLGSIVSIVLVGKQ